MTKTKNGLIYLWLSALVIALDLGSKYLVTRTFELHESVQLLPVFNLTYVRNYGAAFSFLADHSGWQKYFFIAIALVISAILIYWLARTPANRTLANCGYASIIGGALGNMIDRSYHGFVVDFFDAYWDIYHYPVFNVADIAVTLGAAMLILDHFKHPEPKSKQGAA
ncbi:signal peptidase II [Pasteurellaceae bacterium HPA106]|uniref:signal peptidase II n=1 Tax=Spirabiliibacterium pneumoniae TaxID=221400 RepID=UPI001AAD3318|nr:signal peptidase II [Spirabiliibacterium pneumoniae]MBE2896419.1 signal peptidase II [Spirabiliibacterium pneumoniae]